MSRGARFAAATMVVAVSLVLVWERALGQAAGERFRDLQVYRIAGSLVWHTPSELFTFRSPHGAPFTYPPIAAVLFTPLAHVSLDTGGVALGLLTTVAAAAVLCMCLATTGADARRVSSVGVAAFGALMYTLPFRNTVSLGQIDGILLVIVASDLLVVSPSKRGALVGLAAAVKVTALLFIPYLWLSGQRRAAVTATASFATFGALGLIIRPEQSRQFWLHTLWHTSRVGAVSDPRNRSLTGLLTHLSMRPALAGGITAILGLLALVATARADRHDRLAAVAAVGCIACLVTPITWSHHLVWIAPATAAFLLRGRWHRTLAVALLAAYFDWPGERIAVAAGLQTVAVLVAVAVLISSADQSGDRISRGGRRAGWSEVPAAAGTSYSPCPHAVGSRPPRRPRRPPTGRGIRRRTSSSSAAAERR